MDRRASGKASARRRGHEDYDNRAQSPAASPTSPPTSPPLALSLPGGTGLSGLRELVKSVLASEPLYILAHFLENPSLQFLDGSLPHSVEVSALYHLHRDPLWPSYTTAHYHSALLSPCDMRVNIYLFTACPLLEHRLHEGKDFVVVYS